MNLARTLLVERARNKSSGFPVTEEMMIVRPKTIKAGNRARRRFKDSSHHCNFYPILDFFVIGISRANDDGSISDARTTNGDDDTNTLR